jgi:uncharacterized protein YbcV (DUF1398 family)
MTTRYENSDGMDNSISFGEQVIRPSEEEVKKTLLYIIHNNVNLKLPNDSDFNYPSSLKEATRQEIVKLLLFIADNNKDVILNMDHRVTINRLRKEV